jgi:hypothetical protein
MRESLAIDYNNTSALWHKGIKALTEELGPVGMAYFIRQLNPGYGNYTTERDEILSGITNEDIKNELELL